MVTRHMGLKPYISNAARKVVFVKQRVCDTVCVRHSTDRLVRSTTWHPQCHTTFKI